jgi:hypothetical protein
MFNYNINWLKQIKNNLPSFLIRSFRINFILALIKPIKNIYAEFLLIQADYIFKVRFNGQVCYLEKYLNLFFDPGNGIYIDDFAPDYFYAYRTSELKPPTYLYNKWQPTINYLAGEFAYADDGNVYEAAFNNIGKYPVSGPGAAFWSGTTKKPPYIRQRAEFGGSISFIVYVPIALVFDINKMKAIINYYKLAGRGYLIQTY